MGSGQSSSMPKKSEKGGYKKLSTDFPPGSSPYPTQPAYPTQAAYPTQGAYPAQQQYSAPPAYSAQAPPPPPGGNYGPPQQGLPGQGFHQQYQQSGQYGAAPPPYAPPGPPPPPNGIYPGTSGIPRAATYHAPGQAPMPPSGVYPGSGGGVSRSVHGNTGTTVVVRNAFDSGARFDGSTSASLPPPPPGVAPNAAQMATMQGHTVVAQQQQATFWEGSGSGAGYTVW